MDRQRTPSRGPGPASRRRGLAIGATVVVVGLLAGPVLGAGQPDLATSDADRAAADAGADPAAEVALLDGIAAARAAAGQEPLTHHPEAARLARDWSQVMAGAEDLEDIAACADLDDEAPGPVWHPRDPHDDLGNPYGGDIAEVVGCFADEVDAELFLHYRLADEAHAAELLDPAWRHVGVGAVTSAGGATFSAIVLLDGTAAAPDRRGIDGLLAAAGDRASGGDDAVLLAGSGAVTDLLAAAPVAQGAVPALATDRATPAEPDPVLTTQVRHRIDTLTGGEARVVAVGGTDVVSARAAAELEAAGYDLRRVVARDYGVDPDAPIVLPVDVSTGPHAPAVGALTDARVVVGRGDRYLPRESLTRGQMATILARAFDLPRADTQPFVDAGATHGAAIAAAAAAGIVEGFDGNVFRPNQPVTRGQLASMIRRAFELPDASSPAPHTDVAGTAHAPAIAAVVEAGIVGGFPDNTFRPRDTVTRGQTATFVLNSLLFG